MVKEIDLRDFNVDRATPQRESQLRSSVERLNVSMGLEGGAQINVTKIDNFTGNPSEIEFDAPPESSPTENFVRRALGIVHDLGPSLGLAPAQPPEFEPDPFEQQTSSGGVAVHLQQKYKGIPVFQADLAVHFAPDGAPKGAGGRIVTFERDLSTIPRLRAEEAVRIASEYLARAEEEGEEPATDPYGQPLRRTRIDLSNFQPRVLASFAQNPEQPKVLEAGPFGAEIKASLTWFPLGEGPRLAWDVSHVMPNHEGQFRTVVDADSGDVLYCRAVR